MRVMLRMLLVVVLASGGLGCAAKDTKPKQTNPPAASERSQLPQRERGKH
jgi:hypothetical protein